jgi:hypothetical protein
MAEVVRNQGSGGMGIPKRYPVKDENTAAANSYVSPEAFYYPGAAINKPAPLQESHETMSRPLSSNQSPVPNFARRVRWEYSVATFYDSPSNLSRQRCRGTCKFPASREKPVRAVG